MRHKLLMIKHREQQMRVVIDLLLCKRLATDQLVLGFEELDQSLIDGAIGLMQQSELTLYGADRALRLVQHTGGAWNDLRTAQKRNSMRSGRNIGQQ